MPATISVTSTEEVVLTPGLKRKLQLTLKAYAELKQQAKALEAQLTAQKGVIEQLREQTGEVSFKLDGFTVTLIAGTRKTLSKEKLIAMGVTTTMLAEATVETPTKPYTKVTIPGENAMDD